MRMQEYPDISEYLKTPVLRGRKIQMQEILDVPIVVLHACAKRSIFHNGSGVVTTIVCRRLDDPSGEELCFSTGSAVINDQIVSILRSMGHDTDASGTILGDVCFACVTKSVNRFVKLYSLKESSEKCQ